jgi:D-glutamate cyclase
MALWARCSWPKLSAVTDGWCAPAVLAAAAATGYASEKVFVWTEPAAASGIAESLRPALEGLSHLIAIERVGPSHTLESLARQRRPGPPPSEAFQTRVPEARRDHCHNMRGEEIDAYVGSLHRLFEHPPSETRTIGIGDGANEIGMGAVPWEDLARRLSGDHAGWVPCRIAADWNIIAGTSNWGAYALAAGVMCVRGQVDILAPFGREQQRQVLEAMVQHGPAVDGVTRRREVSVDGIPFETYIQPWEEIRRLLGLPE